MATTVDDLIELKNTLDDAVGKTASLLADFLDEQREARAEHLHLPPGPRVRAALQVLGGAQEEVALYDKADADDSVVSVEEVREREEAAE